MKTGDEAAEAGRVLRLARRETVRTWPSYLSTVLVNFLLGLVALGTLWLGVSSGEAEAVLAADLILLAVAANLSTNWTSRNYVYLGRDDPFSAHLSFLKALPVSAGEIVVARTLVMLACTLFMSAVFFLPSYLLSGELRQEAGVGPAQYLGFAAIWAGYALLCAGVILYLELGMGGRAAFWAFMVWAALLVGMITLCSAVLDVGLATGSLGLAGSYGALPGGVSLLLGGVGLVLFARATGRRVRERSL